MHGTSRRRSERRFVLKVARRLAVAAVSYLASALAISALLNASLEASARSKIRERASSVVMFLSPSELGGATPAEARQALVAAMEEAAGLGRPLALRILSRGFRLATFDFGEADNMTTLAGRFGQTTMVRDIIAENAPPTLWLFGVSTLVAMGLGLAIGAAKAIKAGSFGDRASSLAAMVLFGTPAWWVASLAVSLLVYRLRLFPFGALGTVPPPEGFLARAADRASYLLLPVLTLAFVRTWGVAFIARSMILEPYQEDYVMAARGRGLPESRVFRHVVRVASPGLAASAIQYLVAGVTGDFLVEVAFGRPGLGTLLYQALRGDDIPVAGAVLTIATGLTCLGQALLDLVRARLDPRSAGV